MLHYITTAIQDVLTALSFALFVMYTLRAFVDIIHESVIHPSVWITPSIFGFMFYLLSHLN